MIDWDYLACLEDNSPVRYKVLRLVTAEGLSYEDAAQCTADTRADIRRTLTATATRVGASSIAHLVYLATQVEII